LLLFMTASASFPSQRFGLGKTQMMPWVAFAWPGRTLFQ
jgi:hypothetical protein